MTHIAIAAALRLGGSPCAVAIETLAPRVSHPELVARTVTCLQVDWEARRQGAPPALAVALAWHESKFDAAAKSKCGARGALQILPRYWCPNKTHKNCDLTAVGVRVLLEYHDRYGLKDGLAAYVCGPAKRKGEKCKKYADTVVTTMRSLTETKAYEYERW